MDETSHRYFVTKDGQMPCGAPEVLNADFAALMNVSMETAFYRAPRVKDAIAF